jgi:nickel transport protein
MTGISRSLFFPRSSDKDARFRILYRRIDIFLILVVPLVFFQNAALAHTVNYDVQQKGMAVRVFYSANDPASYSEYEVYGPGDTLPHQTGRTDKNGFVAFVPERPGIWTIKVLGESSHGFHGVTTEVKVNEGLNLASFSKPLVATWTKLLTGISVIVGIFGIYAFIRSRKSGSKEAH